MRKSARQRIGSMVVMFKRDCAMMRMQGENCNKNIPDLSMCKETNFVDKSYREKSFTRRNSNYNRNSNT